MLVTGFGPFRNFSENPSAVLAEDLGKNFQVLTVTYPAVERFAKGLDPLDTAPILCLGLNAKLAEPAFELYAHNQIGAEPGSSGRRHTRTLVRQSGPQTLGQTLATPEQLPELPMKKSYSPGNYLCNFLLYSLLIRYPNRKIGFVHIPLFEAMPKPGQVERVQGLLNYLNIQ